MITAIPAACARLDALTNRERLLVALAGLVVLGALFAVTVIQPATKHLAQTRAQYLAQREVMTALTLQKRELEAQLAQHPDEGLKARLRGTERALGELDRDISTLGTGLVAPDRMAGVVKDLLARSPGVSLVALRNLPVSSLTEEAPAADAKTGTVAAPPTGGEIYKHGIEITLEGGWTDLVEYAAHLEALPVRMLWGRTRIDATGYPRVAMTLTLYTLSLERTWLLL